MNEYYKEKLQQGCEYQDFVIEKLYEIGLPIISYSSKKYQNLVGENKCGFEIKYDGIFEKTKNLYIEISEKSDKDNLKYIPSGIFRSDNTWLYIIGNYSEIFIFSKKELIKRYRLGEFETKEIPTSRGFLISKSVAEEISIRKILMN